MKKLATLSILAIAIIMAFAFTKKSTPASNMLAQKSKNHIEVIDFYGTHRCVTCKAIEANTRYTLKTYFANELKNGTIVFKTINVDEEKNYDIAEKFQATGTALFLNVVKDGKEKHIDLTDMAFGYGKNKEEFSKRLKAKLLKELKTL